MFRRQFKARNIIEFFELIMSRPEDEHSDIGDVSAKTEDFAEDSDQDTSS